MTYKDFQIEICKLLPITTMLTLTQRSPVAAGQVKSKDENVNVMYLLQSDTERYVFSNYTRLKEWAFTNVIDEYCELQPTFVAELIDSFGPEYSDPDPQLLENILEKFDYKLYMARIDPC